LSKQLRLDVAQLTDVGRKRPHNEDNMAYVIPKDEQVMARKGALFIVADGMGGHAAGEVASEIAVDTVSNVYYQDDNDDIATSLVHAIKRANTLIHQRAAENMLRSGMGTTCVAAVLRGSTAYIANVGDSRTYLVRRGEVRQISQDHSWVEEQVRAGLLTRDQARSHAQRNVITRCLGTQAEVEVDVFTEQLEEGDCFVLCSDGLSGLVSDDDLRAIIDQYVPQESVYHLVERANDNGGPDNITAIVMRVQEVGWEPPSIRRNGHISAREGGEDAITDAKTLGMPLQVGNGHVPSASLRMPTGPLLSPDNVAAPQPVSQMPRRKRSRLLYPTLVIFILLAVTLVGSGAYYFLHLNTTDFDGSIKKAQSLIMQAKDDVTNKNPNQALQYLASAQTILRSVESGSLTDVQRGRVNTLLGDFTQTAKAAITSYNQQSSIIALPCSTTKTTAVNNGSTNTQANSIATTVQVQNAKGGPKTFSYVLGEDHHLYQLDTNGSLVNKLSSLPNNTQVRKIASDNSHLLALTMLPAQGNTAASYSLNLLTPGESGALTSTNSTGIDPASLQGGKTPTLLTAWGEDVYVVLTSNTSQTAATILYYTIGKNNKLNPGPGQNTVTISASTSIDSIAAFPERRLFFLFNGGSVQSLSFSGGTQTPVPVVVQPSIAAPLPIGPNDFSSNVSVPTPIIQSSTPQSPMFLQVPGGASLVTASVADTLHLYIVDNGNHRVLDLKMMQGTGSAITPTAAASPTPGNTGGGVAGTPPGNPVTMQLNQQYTSPHLLTHVKSIVVDPNDTLVYLLAQSDQNPSMLNLVSVNMSQNMACTS